MPARDPGKNLRHLGIALTALGVTLALGMPILAGVAFVPLAKLFGPGSNLGLGALVVVPLAAIGAVLLAVLPLIGEGLEGAGVRLYAIGHARSELQSRRASARPPAWWFGWVCVLGSAVGFLASEWPVVSSHTSGLFMPAFAAGAVADVLATLTFAVGASNATSYLPRPDVALVRQPNATVVPTVGLSWRL